MDNLEVFKYVEGDGHKLHHEYFSSYVSANWGARAVSAMLFLTDVEEGGETFFDLLKLRKYK